MWMPRKTLEILFRVIRSEIIEQQERVEQFHFIESERALKMYASAFKCSLALEYFLYFSILSHFDLRPLNVR